MGSYACPAHGSEDHIYPLSCVCVLLVKRDTCLCGVEGWDGGGKKILDCSSPLVPNCHGYMFYSFCVYGRS